MTGSGESYASLRAGREPNALLVQAVEALPVRSGRALDVGAGPLNDALFLVRAGLTVDAVDSDPQTVALASELATPGLTVIHADVRELELAAGAYALAVAIHVLPFLPRADIARVLSAIVGGLGGGGILCCTLLGPEDSWAATRPRMTFLSRPELDALLSGLEPIVLEERRYDGADATDAPKRWHVFRCILRKPGDRGARAGTTGGT
jgi:SAM-dependent methyltransferase